MDTATTIEGVRDCFMLELKRVLAYYSYITNHWRSIMWTALDLSSDTKLTLLIFLPREIDVNDMHSPYYGTNAKKRLVYCHGAYFT